MFLLMGGFFVALIVYGFVKTSGLLTICLFVLAVGALNFGKVDFAKGLFALSFVSGLFYLGLTGLPISQVIALAGWALVVVGIFAWQSNRVQGGTLIVLGIGVVLFSQYVRVVLLGG